MIDIQILQSGLKSISDKYQKFDRGQVTLEIKQLFAAIFIKEYDVYANKMGENKWDYVTDVKEYLYDLIVVKEDKSEIENVPYICKTILALESELDNGFKSVMDDFQKLLISNSDYKVMIFKCHSTELTDYLSYMEKNLNHYAAANGTFYLISYLNDKLIFEIKQINLSSF